MAKHYAVVIGDVARSRAHPQRTHLQERLVRTLNAVSAHLPTVQALQITIGDEFQGVFEDIGSALSATLQIPLELTVGTGGAETVSERTDLRFGIGWGTIPVLDTSRTPFAQDGPGWWGARDAIDRVKKLEHKPEWPIWRAAFSADDPTLSSSVNAYLLCRDALLSRMDEEDTRIVLGLVRGENQTSIAKALRVTQSAVSQRLRRNGGYAILRADQVWRQQ